MKENKGGQDYKDNIKVLCADRTASILPDQCQGPSCDTVFCVTLYLYHFVRY